MKCYEVSSAQATQATKSCVVVLSQGDVLYVCDEKFAKDNKLKEIEIFIFDEEKARILRQKRDDAITAFEWRINRNAQEIELGLDPTDDRVKLLQYMQYLRDLPADPDFPEVEIKNFEEWEDD